MTRSLPCQGTRPRFDGRAMRQFGASHLRGKLRLALPLSCRSVPANGVKWGP